ncbi:MAG: hypothetical protein JST50_19930 [Bacteroidetes bacterium]|jgi:hypothetical protein|nr:hypothetical protein [Bacteroidota bacterium]
MKTILITLFLLAAGSAMSFAQCDKKVSLVSSKTEHFDANGNLKHADDEKTVVEFNQSDITVTITHDGGDEKLTGKIKSNICTWQVPFKVGKTLLNVTLSKDDGQSRDFAITVEGKDGKLTLLAESPDEPDDKIRLPLDKFEEVK